MQDLNQVLTSIARSYHPLSWSTEAVEDLIQEALRQINKKGNVSLETAENLINTLDSINLQLQVMQSKRHVRK